MRRLLSRKHKPITTMHYMMHSLPKWISIKPMENFCHPTMKKKNNMTQVINAPFMNLKLYSRIAFAVVFAAVLAACSATSADEDKKARLDKLKVQQAAISKEIQKLESEIAAKNPDSTQTVRAKEVNV